MKLKYTTKLFIVVNAITIVFRTLQILVFTESETGFLKPGFFVVNVIGAVFTALCLIALFINSVQAVRQPQSINCRGVGSATVAGLIALLYLLSGVVALLFGQLGAKLLLVVAVMAAAMCVMMAVSAITGKPFAKGLALLPIPYWVVVLLLSYLHYTERPLRVRTIYEALAVCFVILFTVTFGKAVSGVNTKKSFRTIYPLGLVSCSLCLMCIVPESIAFLVGQSDKVTSSPVGILSSFAAALFTGFFTINTFKKSNTVHPNKNDMVESQVQDVEQDS